MTPSLLSGLLSFPAFHKGRVIERRAAVPGTSVTRKFGLLRAPVFKGLRDDLVGRRCGRRSTDDPHCGKRSIVSMNCGTLIGIATLLLNPASTPHCSNGLTQVISRDAEACSSPT